MIVTTTTTVEGRPLREYLGRVAGETIMGRMCSATSARSSGNITGGRAPGYEKELRKARETVIEEMSRTASALGADAVVAVDIDYETVGNAMLMVTAAGTAVKLG